MTTHRSASLRPQIILIDSEADALADLALAANDRLPEISRMLMEEIGRAQIVPAQDLPPDTVAMQSVVRFRDEATGAVRTVTLVYPAEADIAQDRVSILTPVGAGLIGLREGQSIDWPDVRGKQRAITIEQVIKPGGGHA